VIAPICRCRPLLEAAGVADRCKTVGGDAFKNIPPGGDAYLIKSVLMDEDDERAVEILSSCRRTMARQAKVLVIERGLGAPNEAPEAKFSDLTMMLITGGRERLTEEFRALFTASGFRLEQTILTRSPFSIFVGSPA
jgi:O-methyltransferase domain